MLTSSRNFTPFPDLPLKGICQTTYFNELLQFLHYIIHNLQFKKRGYLIYWTHVFVFTYTSSEANTTSC